MVIETNKNPCGYYVSKPSKRVPKREIPVQMLPPPTECYFQKFAFLKNRRFVPSTKKPHKG